jgi:hypothetical protein
MITEYKAVSITSIKYFSTFISEGTSWLTDGRKEPLNPSTRKNVPSVRAQNAYLGSRRKCEVIRSEALAPERQSNDSAYKQDPILLIGKLATRS